MGFAPGKAQVCSGICCNRLCGWGHSVLKGERIDCMNVSSYVTCLQSQKTNPVPYCLFFWQKYPQCRERNRAWECQEVVQAQGIQTWYHLTRSGDWEGSCNELCWKLELNSVLWNCFTPKENSRNFLQIRIAVSPSMGLYWWDIYLAVKTQQIFSWCKFVPSLSKNPLSVSRNNGCYMREWQGLLLVFPYDKWDGIWGSFSNPGISPQKREKEPWVHHRWWERERAAAQDRNPKFTVILPNSTRLTLVESWLKRDWRWLNWLRAWSRSFHKALSRAERNWWNLQ